MNGEPVLVMLVEDNADHAELVMRTLAEHRVANQIRHFMDGQSALDICFIMGLYRCRAESISARYLVGPALAGGWMGWKS